MDRFVFFLKTHLLKEIWRSSIQVTGSNEWNNATTKRLHPRETQFFFSRGPNVAQVWEYNKPHFRRTARHNLKYRDAIAETLRDLNIRPEASYALLTDSVDHWFQFWSNKRTKLARTKLALYVLTVTYHVVGCYSAPYLLLSVQWRENTRRACIRIQESLLKH